MMSGLADIAVGLGLPVFPCDGNKHPIVKGGFKAATTDRDTIRSQFAQSSARMIGVPTGAVSGLVAIDVDVKNGAAGDAWLQDNADALPPTRTHRTRSGGLHLIFQVPEGIEIRNSASRVAPGVDVRGEGGYIIVPPSPGYQIADDTPPAEMPRWLIRACLKPEREPAPEYQPRERTTLQDGGTPYGLAALSRECDAIRGAVQGTKHDTLNRAAYSIGGLVTAGELQEGVAFQELAAALQDIRAACDDFRAAERTLQTAFRDGMGQPRQVPERPARPEPCARTASGAQPAEARHKDKAKPPLPLEHIDSLSIAQKAGYLVKGLLLSGQMSVVYGESNSGKTFFMVDLGLHIAAGMEWRGRKVRQGLVVYLALEGGQGAAARVIAWRRQHWQDGTETQVPFYMVRCPVDLRDPAGQTQAVIDAVRWAEGESGQPAALVVVDTLSRALSGGNENASEDMGAVVVNADRIRAETQSALAFVHHSGKDTARGARGHSLLRAATDTEIEVLAPADGGKARTARATKQRDLEGGAAFGFELNVVELDKDEDGDAITSCVVRHIESNAETAAPSKRRLPPNASMAFRIFCDAISQGEKAPPGLGVPGDRPAAHVNTLRQHHYSRAEPGATPEAKRQAFGRAVKECIRAGVVGYANDWFWVP